MPVSISAMITEAERQAELAWRRYRLSTRCHPLISGIDQSSFCDLTPEFCSSECGDGILGNRLAFLLCYLSRAALVPMVSLDILPRTGGSGAFDWRGFGRFRALWGIAGADRSRSRRHTPTEFQPNLESIREKFWHL